MTPNPILTRVASPLLVSRVNEKVITGGEKKGGGKVGVTDNNDRDTGTYGLQIVGGCSLLYTMNKTRT